MDRHILHCDLNNFYASVELLSHPELKDIPFAVGGSEQSRSGIILAKNEIAKKLGIKTAETLWSARKKVPNIVIIPPHHDKYYEYSLKVRSIYERYTDQVEAFGIDECWLDVTGSTLAFGSPMDIAEEIRQTVKKELSLTVSIGVSFNKIFAKLGSDMKKPDAITEISRENYRDLVWPLPIGDMLGIGKKVEATFRRTGFITIGDIAKSNVELPSTIGGINGEKLWRYANGIDDSPVTPTYDEPEVKSVGRSITMPKDVYDNDTVWRVILELSEDVAMTLRKEGLCAKGYEVSIKDNQLISSNFSGTAGANYCTASYLSKKCYTLFEKNFSFSNPIRAIGVRATHLSQQVKTNQIDLFGDSEELEKFTTIETTMDTIKSNYGQNTITRARLLGKKPVQIRERKKIKGSFGH